MKKNNSRKPTDAIIKNKPRTDLSYAAEALFILLLCLLPLYMTGQKYTTISQDKVAFMIFSVVLCSVAVGLILLSHLGEKDQPSIGKNRFIRLNIPDAALLCFGILGFLSFLLSPNTQLAFWGLETREDGYLTLLMYMLAYFIFSRYYIFRERDMYIFACAAGILSIIGILQFAGADVFRLFPYDKHPGSTNLTIIFRTTLGNINIVSTFVSACSIFFLVKFVKGKGKGSGAYLVAGFLCFCMLCISDSDSGKFGFIAGAVALTPFFLSDLKSFSRFSIAVSAYCAGLFFYTMYLQVWGLQTQPLEEFLASPWALLMAGALVFTAFVVLGVKYLPVHFSEKTMKRIGLASLGGILLLGLAVLETAGKNYTSGTLYELREILHGRFSDEFGSNRAYIWKKALPLILEKPFFGFGPDGFGIAMSRYNQESLQLFGQIHDKAHNEYIQTLICFGIPAFLAYIAFLASLFAKSLKYLWKKPEILALMAAALTYLAQAFFNISMPMTTPLLYAFLGIAVSTIREYEREKKHNPE